MLMRMSHRETLGTTLVTFAWLAGCGGSHPAASRDAEAKKDVTSADTRDVFAAAEDDRGARDTSADVVEVPQGPETRSSDVAEKDTVPGVGMDTWILAEVGGASEAGGADVGDAKEIGGTTEAGSGSEAGVKDGGGPEVCTQITCMVDFPCAADQPPSCAYGNPRAIVSYETVSCAVVCGTPCCSGAQCRSMSRDCPSGTACAYPSVPTSALGAKGECLDEARTCGGADNITCPTGQYCEYFQTLCSGSNCPGYAGVCDKIKAGDLGICTTSPAYSTCDTTNPVCGCDGKSYENECARKFANMARAYTGACK
jgi:hypothetical protein